VRAASIALQDMQHLVAGGPDETVKYVNYPTFAQAHSTQSVNARLIGFCSERTLAPLSSPTRILADGIALRQGR
jgi:hypothetical protein